MISIDLTDHEIQIIKLIGGMRYLIARSNNIKDKKVSDINGLDMDAMGFAAEYAFAKAMNTFPDLGLIPRSGSADGIFNGKRYDIKATERENGRLLCTMKFNPDVDVYVLAIVKIPNVKFVGWAYSYELRKEKNIVNLGRGETYALDQEQLRRFKISK